MSDTPCQVKADLARYLRDQDDADARDAWIARRTEELRTEWHIVIGQAKDGWGWEVKCGSDVIDSGDQKNREDCCEEACRYFDEAAEEMAKKEAGELEA